MKSTMWWGLINTPRKAVCCATVVVDFISIIGMRFMNLDLTEGQMLSEYWPNYLLIIASAVVAYLCYPKD